MKNSLVKMLGMAVLAIALLFLGRDVIAKVAVEGACQAATGLRLGIGRFHSSLLKSTLEILASIPGNRILRTDQLGAVTINSDGKSVSL